MAFCTNCGKELVEGAKFCFECGTPVEKTDETVRRTVFSGEIHKCPSCGETLQSMTAICPSCGHELNSAKLSPALKEFIDEINECDKLIANTPKNELPKKGWKTWGDFIRVLWIILNILTLCIPLVIYLALPLFRPLLGNNVVPELSSTEKRKVALIENFTFPNDRESVLEALLFIKSKIAFLASEKVNEKNAFWLRLWNTKATQLHQKANILLNNDTIAETAYSEIIASKNTIDKKIRIRAGVGAAIIVIFIVFAMNYSPLVNGITNSISNKKFEWLEAGLSTKIPEINVKSGQVQANNDKELRLSLGGVTYNQFDKYINSCKNVGYTVDAEKDTNTYKAFNGEGYLLNLSFQDKNLNIELKAPLVGDENFTWPTHKFASLIPQVDKKTGSIKTETEETLEIILYDISAAEVENYIAKCENFGFTVDAEKKDTSFNGFNTDGYKLSIAYNEMRAMSITVKAPLKWPSHKFASLIPQLNKKTGIVKTEKEETLEIILYDISASEIKNYIAQCENFGFTVDTEKKDTSFSGFNTDGYKLSVSYANEGMKAMNITVEAPMQFNKINWPTTGPATLLPKPTFEVGKISSDSDSTFSVYIGDMTLEDFNSYVDKCIDKGFEKDYRSEHHFSADKGENVRLTVDYVGFNTVEIYIHLR